MSLIAYFKIWQEGIEPLPYESPLTKDESASHYYFDDFRIAVQYYFNEKEKSAGLGILTFAPNGRLWSQSGEHAFNLNEVGGTYLGIDEALKEAEKSKAKNVTVLLGNKQIVSLLNTEKPFKEPAYTKIHDHLKERVKKYKKFEVVYREKFPKSVQDRLNKEPLEASEPPRFDANTKRWINAQGTSYFNVGMDEKDEKFFIEQYARLIYDFTNRYFKDYEEDYGKEALKKLNEKAEKGKLKDLPALKRNKKNQKRTIKARKFPEIKKKVLCQNCENEMRLENCFLEKPENDYRYHFRCDICLATRVLNEKGRTVEYGRFLPRVS